TTGAGRRLRARRAVHPHARGDDGPRISKEGCKCGTPPRAWGRPERPDRGTYGIRYTPTRVGTTTAGSARVVISSVHPHARGDDHAPQFAVVCVRGTPPRAWGRLGGFLQGQIS